MFLFKRWRSCCSVIFAGEIQLKKPTGGRFLDF